MNAKVHGSRLRPCHGGRWPGAVGVIVTVPFLEWFVFWPLMNKSSAMYWQAKYMVDPGRAEDLMFKSQMIGYSAMLAALLCLALFIAAVVVGYREA